MGLKIAFPKGMGILLTWLFMSFSTSAQMSCQYLFAKPMNAVRGADDIETSDPNAFRYYDSTYKFLFEADLGHGIVTIETHLQDAKNNIRSVYRGRDLYAQMMEHFGRENVIGIMDFWANGTNLKEFYENRLRGDSVVQAAFKTWSGRQAVAHGFYLVHVMDPGSDVTNGSNERRPVEVVFLRPKEQLP